MSAENKKLVWIAVAVSVFVLVLAVVGVLFFAPKKGMAAAPATVGNIAAPKASDPQDFLSLPPQSMPTQTAPNKDGDVIVIYGDNPPSLTPTAPASGIDDAAALQAAAAAAAKASGQVPASAYEPANQPLAAGGTASVPAAPAATAAPAAQPKAQAPAKTAAKAAPAATPAKAVTTAKAKPADQYWVQAASFSSRGKADDLKEKLSAKGMASIITVKDINGKSWYRVRIGPWGTNAEASGWLAKIKTVQGCEESVIWKEGAPVK